MNRILLGWWADFSLMTKDPKNPGNIYRKSGKVWFMVHFVTPHLTGNKCIYWVNWIVEGRWNPIWNPKRKRFWLAFFSFFFYLLYNRWEVERVYKPPEKEIYYIFSTCSLTDEGSVTSGLKLSTSASETDCIQINN